MAIIPGLSGEVLASFVTLTFLEIVLGIDNLIFLALAVNQLAPEQRHRGRWIGQILAMGLRIAMLISLVWAAELDVRLFTFIGRAITVKDLVLIVGGLFLLAKGTLEIQDSLEVRAAPVKTSGRVGARFSSVMLQIGLINIVFSIDSVVTAVGMTTNLAVMIAAVAASTLVMLFAAKAAGDFIQRRPTLKLLALAFVLLVGVALVADGIGFHIPRAYIYFAIAFSLFVEGLNAIYRRLRADGAAPSD